MLVQRQADQYNHLWLTLFHTDCLWCVHNIARYVKIQLASVAIRSCFILYQSWHVILKKRCTRIANQGCHTVFLCFFLLEIGKSNALSRAGASVVYTKLKFPGYSFSFSSFYTCGQCRFIKVYSKDKKKKKKQVVGVNNRESNSKFSTYTSSVSCTTYAA